MRHLLKRHLIPISAHFDHVLVLTYAFPGELLAPLVPRGLDLDTFDRYGFVAIATVQTRALRPSFLPEALGMNFFLAGYRIFTKLKTADGRLLRGLKILRSDTDRQSMVRWGNLLTHYGYQKADVVCRTSGESLDIRVRTSRGDADLEVSADLRNMPGPLPEGSPFPDVAAARKFAGPLAHTFDYETESASMVVVRGVRHRWDPQPISVSVHQHTFLDQAPFREARPLLANAFYMKDVPYRWERGWLEPLSPS
jgi:uncharacterized protein YqjF (DUF2071 family)